MIINFGARAYSGPALYGLEQMACCESLCNGMMHFGDTEKERVLWNVQILFATMPGDTITFVYVNYSRDCWGHCGHSHIFPWNCPCRQIQRKKCFHGKCLYISMIRKGRTVQLNYPHRWFISLTLRHWYNIQYRRHIYVHIPTCTPNGLKCVI